MINASYLSNQNRAQNTLYGNIQSKRGTKEIVDRRKDSNLKEMVRKLNGKADNTGINTNSILDSTKSYGESIRAQRQSANNTAMKVKKLKYNFKNISSQIMRSKTSVAARQVEGQARREVLRLKREKLSGKYDSEEIEAALEHAKAMERVAKKKVKHLVEEELAKAGMGATGIETEEPEKEELEEDKETEDSGDEIPEEDMPEQYEDEYSLEGLFDMTQAMPNFEQAISSIDMLSEEMLEEFSDSLKELLEDTGLEELEDSLMAFDPDMDAGDLKEMQIKHRNKEMKDMVKADAEYLKAMFDHLEKVQSGQAAPDIPAGGFDMSGGMAAMPVIDLVL